MRKNCKKPNPNPNGYIQLLVLVMSCLNVGKNKRKNIWPWFNNRFGFVRILKWPLLYYELTNDSHCPWPTMSMLMSFCRPLLSLMSSLFPIPPRAPPRVEKVMSFALFVHVWMIDKSQLSSPFISFITTLETNYTWATQKVTV